MALSHDVQQGKVDNVFLFSESLSLSIGKKKN